jgi:hypothetical protein
MDDADLRKKYYYVHLFCRICYFQHTTLTFNSGIKTFSYHLKITKSNTNTAPTQLTQLRRYHFANNDFPSCYKTKQGVSSNYLTALKIII